jgi:hypothetical protein
MVTSIVLPQLTIYLHIKYFKNKFVRKIRNHSYLSMEFDQNFDDPEIFEEAYIPDVDMEATTSVTTSRCRRQGTFLVLPILC